jgi:hypothetical protein
MARSHTMTPARRAALKRAQLASARKRKKIRVKTKAKRIVAGGAGIATGAAIAYGAYRAHPASRSSRRGVAMARHPASKSGQKAVHGRKVKHLVSVKGAGQSNSFQNRAAIARRRTMKRNNTGFR